MCGGMWNTTPTLQLHGWRGGGFKSAGERGGGRCLVLRSLMAIIDFKVGCSYPLLVGIGPNV